MNREILFHGKRIDNDEWVEGCLLIGFTGIHYIITLHDHILGITEMYEVDPSTVGQYTGLTDKNGVKIFDGDVLRLYSELENYTWTAVVEFGNPNCTYNWGWHLKPLAPCHQNPDILLWVNTDLENIEAEIISNIHDGKDGQNDEL